MRAYRLNDSTQSAAPDDLQHFGIAYWNLPPDESARAASLAAIKQERGYVDEDVVVLSADNPDYATICAKFDREHSHALDEVRFVLDGEGIFDVRDGADDWIRIEVAAGDLIVIPAGKYHRFSMTGRNYIRCMRLFADHSGWVPEYRT